MPWWLGLPPAETEVDCAGSTHRIRWNAGTLTTPDHDDPDGERALAALGGPSCRCVEILDAWVSHRNDLRMLAVTSRGAADPLTWRPDPPRKPSGGPFVPQGHPGPVPVALGHSVVARAVGRIHGSATSSTAVWGGHGHTPMPAGVDGTLLDLLGIGGALLDRLVATVLAHWTQRLRDDPTATAPARPQLVAALHGRVALATRSWLGQPGLTVHVAMTTDPDSCAARRGSDGVEVVLPFDWLSDVWARGLATFFGRLVLGLRQTPDSGWEMTTVGQDLGAASLVRVAAATPAPES